MYNKLLIAKYSPENSCFANEGEVLTVVPQKPLPKRDGKYHFMGSQSKKKSQYGWIMEVEPFSLDDFIQRYASNPTDEEERDLIKTMLDAAKLQKEETPMAASFVVRGVMEKRIIFTVHKIFLY